MKSPQLEHIRPTAKVAPLAGAWIEILYFLQRYCVFFVAPLAGAWIEMLCNMYKNEQTLSLPSRERGLKCRSVRSWIFGIVVAPLAGAWIEIMKNEIIGAENIVAPLAGAWIEIKLIV